MKSENPQKIYIYDRGQHIFSKNSHGEEIVVGTWNSLPDKEHKTCYILEDKESLTK